MNRLSLGLFLALCCATVLAQQRIRPDGMGGYIISSPPDFSMFRPEQSLPVQLQRLELQKQKIENQRLQNESLKRSLERDQSTPQYATQESQGGSTLKTILVT